MRHYEKKNLNIFFSEGFAKVFPRALLWLSTGMMVCRTIFQKLQWI